MAIVTQNAVITEYGGSNSVVLKDDMYRDELLAFAGAGKAEIGTILARETASGKLVPFVKGGTGGAEVPNAVLTYDVEVDAVGDVAIRAMVVGKVRKQRLIIAADGDDSNVDAAVNDGLRQDGSTCIDVAEPRIL